MVGSIYVPNAGDVSESLAAEQSRLMSAALQSAESQAAVEELKALRKETLRDLMKTYLRQELRFALREHDPELLHQYGMRPQHFDIIKRGEEISKLLAAEAKDRNDGKANTGWFITLNPADDRVTPGKLWELAVNWVTRCRSLEGAYVVIEQRSEDPNIFKGFHIHMCLRFSDEMARSTVAQRQKAITSVLWTPQEQKERQFKQHWYVLKPLCDHHKKYVEGDKKDEKLAKVEVDKVFRERYGFPPAFTISPEKIFPVPVIENDGLPSLSQDGPEGSGLR